MARKKQKATPRKPQKLEGAKPHSGPDPRWIWLTLVAAVIGTSVWIAFGQAVRNDFVNFDDEDYVYGNNTVRAGLTWRGLAWAFSGMHASNWHPVTWISHMSDVQLFGVNPSGHHFTSILLHGLTAIILFIVLLRMTGAFWPGVCVALIFALHPLRVESVVWVAERKDLLSGLFFVLSLWAYYRHTREVGSRKWYVAVVAFFVLGLLSKPMLVTLPFVLMLVDYWPLGRFVGKVDERRWLEMPRFLLVEKIPLLAITAVFCGVTILAQQEALQPLGKIPLSMRLENAVITYVKYAAQIFYPVGLAVFYPYPKGGWSYGEVLLAAAVIGGVSVAVWRGRKQYPYCFVGWFWYLGMSIPTIGVVQVGAQSSADRYTYLPQIGLYIALVWMLTDIVQPWQSRHKKAILGAIGGAVVIAMILATRTYVSYWRDAGTLWRRALACTKDNSIAHSNLGNFLLRNGNVREAIAHYEKAIEIDPKYTVAYNNIGHAYIKMGDMDGAMRSFEQAVRLSPENAEGYSNLGNILLTIGRQDEALWNYAKALEINPRHARAHNNLGSAYARSGDYTRAEKHFLMALESDPFEINALNNMGALLLRAGHKTEARNYFYRTLAADPDNLRAQSSLRGMGQ